ncbi:MAG: protein tyrosine phosphatase (PTP) superfamily phosphohydrolase (DUF442 family) [Rickettsiales bacterium]|jgi:protein tyrosine phosphatase (PTP) superfamily phosphohydrolase (DUF442 family)
MQLASKISLQDQPEIKDSFKTIINSRPNQNFSRPRAQSVNTSSSSFTR